MTASAKSRRAGALMAAPLLAPAVCFYLYYTTEISNQLGGWPLV